MTVPTRQRRGGRLILDREYQPIDWTTAACRDVGTELFYPDTHGYRIGDRTPYIRALGYCRACPMLTDCLAYGLTERHGVWGGTTPEERAAMRRV